MMSSSSTLTRRTRARGPGPRSCTRPSGCCELPSSQMRMRRHGIPGPPQRMPWHGRPSPRTAWEADMRRGEIVTVNLDPARGAEASKTGPAVVVSNDAANATAARLGRGVVSVVPVTSNIARIYPFQVLLPAGQTGLPRDSKAQAEQIRSVAVERIGTHAVSYTHLTLPTNKEV